jgi:hypothetical protein
MLENVYSSQLKTYAGEVTNGNQQRSKFEHAAKLGKMPKARQWFSTALVIKQVGDQRGNLASLASGERDVAK